MNNFFFLIFIKPVILGSLIFVGANVWIPGYRDGRNRTVMQMAALARWKKATACAVAFFQ